MLQDLHDRQPAQRAKLRAFCDTLFASTGTAPDPHGLHARQASDFGVDYALFELLSSRVPEPALTSLWRLIDAWSEACGPGTEQALRETRMHQLAASSAEAGAGLAMLQKLVLALCYALPDAQGQNPNWPALSYPGPRPKPAPAAKALRPLDIAADTVLDADVCVVGSGAGGGVIADALAQRGLSVVVLEAGGYFSETDFNQLELWAYQNLYWRGGITPTADGNVQLVAGGALGGGTLVNWQNCVRPPDAVRREWARAHGLHDLDTASFDAHIDQVLERLMANDRCSELNGPHQRLRDAASSLGYAFKTALRSVDPRKHDPELAGFHGFGDVTGSRRSSLNAYLEPAQAAGARIVVGARAERILVTAGRAHGVVARCVRADRTHSLEVRARHVVCACGALETPALLLRSGIGGPAVGQYLRLHPVVSLAGVYAEEQRPWWGPAQAALCDEFLQLRDDHGFLIECAHHSLSSAAASIPWRSARDHKVRMTDLPHTTAFIAIVRDRGHGRVRIDATGASVPTYALDDELDRAHLARATLEMARLHQAAGAQRMLTTVGNELREYTRGEALSSFVEPLASAPYGAGGRPVFSAHQMGSARMGTDPEESVAQPSGELHDTRGVWIGDTSAFPTAPGVNPALTCMALAARTAAQLANQPR
ncbi:MAG: GMC family oxidoreductase [Myxococcales bacterium]